MRGTVRFLAAILLYGGMAVAAYAAEETNTELGSIKGRITDSDKEILPGATVMIEELHSGATSDVNGFYTIPNLKPGTYNVKVSYVGYQPKVMTVKIESNSTVENDIVLDEGAALQEVVVNGVFQGQRKALQMQKSNMGVTNVVSADQVGKFPDSNIGDALKRINGVNVQYDQGEARFGQVRGTSADLTSVTVNGNRIPSAEGDTRNVQLDLIPADMIQTIELSKVVTSDMDGDAIGGEINLVTKSTPYSRTITGTAGSGYSWVSEKLMLNLGFTYGDRFFGNKLGMMLSASYQYNPGGSDNAEFEYDVDDGEVVLDKAEVRQYYVTRERQSYSAAFDYNFNSNNKINLKVIYNRRNDWENRYRLTYKKLSSSESKQSVVLQTKGGSGDTRDARLERQQTLDASLGGEHHIGKLALDWGATFSRASEERPSERYFGIAIKEAYSSTFTDVGGRYPHSTASLPSISDDWSIDELTNGNQSIFENEWKFKVNFLLPLGDAARYGKLKFGAKYVDKTKHKSEHNYDYADAYEDLYGSAWTSNMTSQIRSGFMVGDFYPIGTPFISKKYLSSLNLTSMNGEEVLEDASGNYRAHESITSGYLRYDRRLTKKLDMTLGVRMEYTNLNYSGYNWIVDEDESESLVATGEDSNDYINVLPSALFKYNVTEDFTLRASFTETLSRPKYSQLVPTVSYTMADEEATIGNSNLKPTTSFNYDISAEYYFSSVGLVSLGLFYKDLRNVIVDEVWKGSSSLIPATAGEEYEITRPTNGYDANLFGVEFAYERDFSFIAPALKCLGFYGTYTYTHTSTKNLSFENRVVEDGEKIKMMGTPEHTANASLYFDKAGINVRLSYNFASSFVDEYGTSSELDIYYDKVNYLDLNASYTFGKTCKTTIFADVTNILNQPLRYYQGTSSRTCQVEYYGAKLTAGVKVHL